MGKKTYRISVFTRKRGRILLPTIYADRKLAQAIADNMNENDKTHLLGATVQEEI